MASPESNGHKRPIDEETPLLGGAATHGPHSALEPPEDYSSPSPQEEGEVVILPNEISTVRLVTTLAAIWVGVFLGALDSTIIATLSAPISTSFNSLSLLSWLASAYLIANAACQPLSGRLTDIFSRRTGLVVSNILFAVGNLICGLAKDEWSMIAGRVVAGMGGGGLMAISTFVGTDLVPLRKRGIIQGIGNVCFGAGAGLGGVYGGWVNDVWGWRYAFLSQVPFVIISGILVFFLVNIPPKKSEKSKLSRVDFLGSFTLVTTLVLLLLGLNSGGNVVPWNHPLVYVSLPLSGVSLAAFIYIEAKVAKEPVIPVKLLLDRTVAAACLTNWFLTMATFMIVFYLPIFFQLKGNTATQAGARFIPQSIGTSIGSLGSGLIMNRTGKYKILGLVVVGTEIIGIGLLQTLTFHTPTWPASIHIFLMGTGYGGMLTMTLIACLSAVSHDHQAVVTSATYAFRSTGSTIGITIGSAVYQNILNSELFAKFGDQEGADEIIKRIRDSLDELKHLPEGWRQGVMDSYEDAMKGVFWTAFLLGILAFITTALMRQHVLHSTLDRK
ncbi:major facilitator superfamily domain-containing protein [Xylogone sp. PMI_703]|nr:major facilitator superfamily domain-containing protein [Xylogone sp. PMI_703]